MSEAQRGWLSSFSSLPSMVFPHLSWFSHGSPDRSSDLSAGSWPVVFSYNSSDLATTSEALIDVSSVAAEFDSCPGEKVIRADRPRNSRRPWLPRFCKLKRYYPVRYNSAKNQTKGKAEQQIIYRRQPRLTRLPRHRFLAETRYSGLLPFDTRIDDTRYALEPLCAYQPQRSSVSPQEARTSPQGLRPPENEEAEFVDINGIRTNKRRAEDTEVDLVAALQDSQRIDRFPSSVTTPREGFRPNSECLFQKKLEAHMSKAKPLSELFTGMMTNILSSFADLTGRFRRLLYNQTYDISESRSLVEREDQTDLHVANKRVKITTDKSDFHWLDQDGLELLLLRYNHFGNCFTKAGSILQSHPLRADVNKILRPLLPVLADNVHDLNALRIGEDGVDLCSLWLCLCRTMLTTLDGLYEIGMFIKMKDKYARVPATWPYPSTSSKVETAARIKAFLSAPSLFVVLDRIFELSDEMDSYPIPTDMIDRVVLDLTAFQHNIVHPSFVQSKHFHQKLSEEFPPPRRMDADYSRPILPGAFPEIGPKLGNDGGDAESNSSYSPSPLPFSLPPQRPELPPFYVAQKGATKTERMRMKLLAAEICRRPPEDFPTKYHRSSHDGRTATETYTTDLTRRPLSTTQIGVVQSILKNRKTPKRLGATRNPKSVRFSEATLSPRQRTHLGLDVPKHFPKSGRPDRSGLIGDRQLAQSQYRNDSMEKSLDLDEMEYLRIQRMNRHVDSIFHGTKRLKPKLQAKAPIDHSHAIKNILSLPSIEPLAISDDTKAGIIIKKEEAAQKAAQEAKKLAEERARQEREERLAKSGGLRVPEQPLVLPLGSNWHARVQATLHASTATTLATTGEGVDLRRHDFAKVVPATEWLNDEIVNGSLNWLDQSINSAAGIKDIKKSTRKCLAMSSFFFKRLQEQGVGRTQRTLRRYGVDKANFFHVDTILLPICEHSHWTLLVIRPSKKTIAHMDSMNPRGSQQYITLGLAWLKDILEENFVADEWKVAQHEAPRQTNGYDCGVHTITNGMCLALGLNPIDSYAAKDMPQQRLRLASMLLNGGFKGDFDLRIY